MTSLPDFSGGVTRPQGSDSYPPEAGTRVSWHAAQPVVDMATEAVTRLVTAYVIGDVANHLRKHGDHTPWSAGKVRGVVYATDIMIHDVEPARTRLVAYLKSSADTRWIDFLNFAGKQYDHAGNIVADSADYHLHVSVNKGYENAKGTTAREFVHYVLTGQHLTPQAAKPAVVTPKPAPKPVPVKPTPTNTPPAQEDDEDMRLIQVDGHPEVYKTNGLFRVLVANSKALAALEAAGYKRAVLPAGTDLSAFGPVVDAAKAV